MDDEPLALSQLTAYIEKVPFLSLVAACPDTFSAMQTMDESPVDAIFADINMPDLNGLEFIRSLSNPPLVVFTTAYSDYAIEGYKVNAVDYLLKPFSFEELLAAAQKVRHQYELIHPGSQQQETKEPSSFIYIKAGHAMNRLSTDSILYIEGLGEYVRIYTNTTDKPLTCLLSMRKIEEKLPKDSFLRVHKSYIVNMAKAISACRTSISFSADKYIPIGDAYRDAVFNYIDRYSLK